MIILMENAVTLYVTVKKKAINAVFQSIEYENARKSTRTREKQRKTDNEPSSFPSSIYRKT